jgi:hypothetical protein
MVLLIFWGFAPLSHFLGLWDISPKNKTSAWFRSNRGVNIQQFQHGKQDQRSESETSCLLAGLPFRDVLQLAFDRQQAKEKVSRALPEMARRLDRHLSAA